jgi:hypothetical protein
MGACYCHCPIQLGITVHASTQQNPLMFVREATFIAQHINIVVCKLYIVFTLHFSVYKQNQQLMHFLLTTITSRHIFRHLMLPSSGDIHCE